MTWSPEKRWILRPLFLVGLLSLELGPAMAGAGEKIPALVSIPETLQEGERRRLAGQQQALRQQFAALQAAANAFNAKTAENQTDAEFAAVQAMRKSYLDAAKEFNQTVAAEAVSTDAMVVDARHVPSGLDSQTEKWLAGYSTVPGVSDRLRKGWQAFKANDLNAASAWFEDALNHDPNNPDLKFFVDRCHGQQKLVSSPAYHDAVTRGITNSHSAGDLEGEQVAAKESGQGEGLLVLPKDRDIEFLFPGLDPDEQIRSGLALPTKNEQLNQTLKEHPELKAPLLAAWKHACAEREQEEAASMAAAVRQLTATVASLGLPYGKIEGALAKDPRLQAAWQASIEKAGNEEFFGEIDAALSALGKFDATVQNLRESTVHSANPYELK